MIVNTIGKMVLLEAGLLLLPLATALVYGESCAVDFLITIGISAAVGLLLVRTVRPRSSVIYAREGFVICAVTWLVFSAIGALPFVLSGEIPNYIDAIFETVSGFTTTGASILTDVESMSHGMLLWRSFTHWVGGMGILVFIVAVLPSTSDRTIHILRAEMPGPTMGKIVPRLRDTAKILYLIYLGMTVVEVILLLAGGMSFLTACSIPSARPEQAALVSMPTASAPTVPTASGSSPFSWRCSASISTCIICCWSEMCGRC